MAYYAFINEENIVTEVIAGNDEGDTDWETHYGNFRGQMCKRTSFNTRGGVHYGQDGQPDGGAAYRANYAGIGYTYDFVNDVFYAPQPYPSWTIEAPTWIWTAPIPYPEDGKIYNWDESTKSWVTLE